MSYQRMTLVERMDIFKLLYAERLKPSAIAAALNRRPSSVAREVGAAGRTMERGGDRAASLPPPPARYPLFAPGTPPNKTYGLGGRLTPPPPRPYDKSHEAFSGPASPSPLNRKVRPGGAGTEFYRRPRGLRFFWSGLWKI
jgi:hypothetical protein